jgi:primosomal protein N'
VIAKVIVDISLDREFDYAVPPELAARVFVGSRVGVPFGHRQTEGYVIALADGSEVATLKPIERVIGDHPFIDDSTVTLARWMSHYYCARLEQCIRTVLPGAVRRKGDRFKTAARRHRQRQDRGLSAGHRHALEQGGARSCWCRRFR